MAWIWAWLWLREVEHWAIAASVTHSQQNCQLAPAAACTGQAADSTVSTTCMAQGICCSAVSDASSGCKSGWLIDAAPLNCPAGPFERHHVQHVCNHHRSCGGLCAKRLVDRPSRRHRHLPVYRGTLARHCQAAGGCGPGTTARLVSRQKDPCFLGVHSRYCMAWPGHCCAQSHQTSACFVLAPA